MLNYPILLAIIMSGVTAYGQGVIVNPDGSHSTVHGSVIVNPNGTHSTIYGSGNSAVIVNPDGTHSTKHGSVIVNPNGTHSTVHGSGNSGIIVNPDGTHTTIHGSDVDPAIVNSTRNHSLIPDSGDTNQDRKQRIKRNKRRRTLPDQELN